jgi:outer membrane protein assembly factor BamD
MMPEKPMKIIHRVLLAILVSTAAAACTSTGGIGGDSPEEAYETGMEYFEKGNYRKSILAFQRVFEFGRVHDWADDSQFMLARSYYEDGQYLLSANEFERYIGLYPGDERSEDAAYYRAMSYYNLSPPYNLDASDTEKAIDFLRLYLAAYPNSEHREEVGAKIDELQEKLATKLMETARLYERSNQYLAAVLTYKRVLDEYPTSEPVDEALLGAMRAQIAYADASILTRQRERYEEAIEIYDRLYQLFPDSPYLKDAEVLYAEVQEKIEGILGG